MGSDTDATGTVRVGTSGWQYDDWKGRFYPDDVPKTRWLEHYTRHFSCVELNGTFYRLPSETSVQRWHDRAPDRFRYAVKASRYVTHQKKLRDPEEPVRNVVERCAGLKSFLGVWLWQLPGQLHRDVPRLERFLQALPGSARHAVEFRHPSWYDAEVENALRAHQVAWVWLSDGGAMPAATPVTAPFVYLRLHGLAAEDAHRWDYSGDELAPWVDHLREVARDGHDAWVFFNNDHRARAPRNALTMVDMLGDVAMSWPPR